MTKKKDNMTNLIDELKELLETISKKEEKEETIESNSIEEEMKVLKERKNDIKKNTNELLELSQICFVAISDCGMISSGTNKSVLSCFATGLNEFIKKSGLPRDITLKVLTDMLSVEEE